MIKFGAGHFQEITSKDLRKSIVGKKKWVRYHKLPKKSLHARALLRSLRFSRL